MEQVLGGDNVIFTSFPTRIYSAEQEAGRGRCVCVCVKGKPGLLTDCCHHPVLRFYSPESQRVRSASVDHLLNSSLILESWR